MLTQVAPILIDDVAGHSGDSNSQTKDSVEMHPLLRAMTCTFRHAETSLGLPVIARPTGADSHRETVKVQPGIELGRMRKEGLCQVLAPGVNELAGGRGR